MTGLVHRFVTEDPNLTVNISGKFVDEQLSSVSSAGAVLVTAELKLIARWKRLCAMADKAEHGQGVLRGKRKVGLRYY
jgi:hypothetical protein